MLTFDSVRLRLEREQPLTFLEFNYMILQGYDFLELSRRYGCTLQMGGSDQWGNIVNGVELGAPHRRQAAVRPDDAADHHRIGRQDGQDARRAPSGSTRDRLLALRVLAVLAQHRGRRCRPLPAPVHRSAAGRDRSPRSAGRGRDQRGEEDPRDRSHAPGARRGGRAPKPRKPRGATFEEGEAADTLPSVELLAANWLRASPRFGCSPWPGWPAATARRAGSSVAAGRASTICPLRMRARPSRWAICTTTPSSSRQDASIIGWCGCRSDRLISPRRPGAIRPRPSLARPAVRCPTA